MVDTLTSNNSYGTFCLSASGLFHLIIHSSAILKAFHTRSTGSNAAKAYTVPKSVNNPKAPIAATDKNASTINCLYKKSGFSNLIQPSSTAVLTTQVFLPTAASDGASWN